MLNRKENKLANGTDKHHSVQGRSATPSKPRRHLRRFIISSKAAGHPHPAPAQNLNGAAKVSKPSSASQVKAAYAGRHSTSAPGAASQPVDLTETIKTLLSLNQEHGHVTYDDINDVLPDGLSPNDLDELYTKLRSLDVEIVDHAEVERAKPAEPEEEEDSRLEVLDDPVRMYMNQMGKVPLIAWWWTKKSPTAKAISGNCVSSSKRSAPSIRWWTRHTPPGKKLPRSAAGITSSPPFASSTKGSRTLSPNSFTSNAC